MKTIEEKPYLNQRDLYDMLPFSQKKVLRMLRSGQLPVVKMGRDYITTRKMMDEWL